MAVAVPLEGAEEARARMLELVPAGFEEVEAGDRLELVAYVDTSGEERLRSAFPDAVGTGVEDDWPERWRSFHRGIRAGGLWIGPPWEAPHAGERAVVIEPGRAFGTGAHPTSRLCVELLAGVKHGSLVDVGCGSGVLAIAAARLGFSPVTAVDVDPVAIEVTRANAAANGVRLAVFLLDALREEPPTADVTVANILLEPVVHLLSRLRSRVAVTSGYLAGERPAAPAWAHSDRRELDGWAADVFTRRE